MLYKTLAVAGIIGLTGCNSPPREERCTVVESNGALVLQSDGTIAIRGTRIHTFYCEPLTPTKDPFSLNPQSSIESPKKD